jgi:hypothetical protein
MRVRQLWTAASAAVMVAVCPALAGADQRPMMSADRPVQCLKDNQGQLWRVQCDEASKTCLYAPNEELDSAGNRSKPLERARRCSHFGQSFNRAELEAKGYSFVPGRPDAPYGWTRDDRGRVFQINFDLRRRLYFGAKYTPNKLIGEPFESKRTGIDFGLLSLAFNSDGDRTRHRLRLVEGEVRLEPFAAELVLVHYDLSRKFIDPLLRVTTFFGEPQRHDLYLNIGLWTEGGGLEIHHTDAANSSLWKFGTAQMTFDLWQSSNIESFARLRTGVGFERLYTEDAVGGNRSAFTGSSALELDWILDRAGHHNLKAVASIEVPRYFDPVEDTGKTARRARARINYEAIVLALNDQPLSVTLGAGGERRNDLPGIKDDWAFVADAGLRFSLWAPPRKP